MFRLLGFSVLALSMVASFADADACPVASSVAFAPACAVQQTAFAQVVNVAQPVYTAGVQVQQSYASSFNARVGYANRGFLRNRFAGIGLGYANRGLLRNRAFLGAGAFLGDNIFLGIGNRGVNRGIGNRGGNRGGGKRK